MLHRTLLLTVMTGCFSTLLLAQTVPKVDSLTRPTAPIFVQTTFLIPIQEVGFQVSIGTLVAQQEKHLIRKSGREKVIFKDRIVSVTPGFYYQKYLHTNLFLTVDYAFVRRHRSGVYSKFAPFVGLSRTFLNAIAYTVDANGVVTEEKTAGDWRALAGFSTGIGRRFDTKKPGLLRDIYLTLNIPFFYPNFRSVAIKPSVQIGAAFNLNQVTRSFSKTVKTIRR